MLLFHIQWQQLYQHRGMYNTKSTPTSILWRDGAPCCPLEVDPPQGMSGDTCCRVPAEKDDTGPRASSTPNNDGKTAGKIIKSYEISTKTVCGPVELGILNRTSIVLAKGLRSPASCIFISVTEGLPARAFLSYKRRLEDQGKREAHLKSQGPTKDTIWHNLTQLSVVIYIVRIQSAKFKMDLPCHRELGIASQLFFAQLGRSQLRGSGQFMPEARSASRRKQWLHTSTLQIGIQYPFNHRESWGCGDAR